MMNSHSIPRFCSVLLAVILAGGAMAGPLVFENPTQTVSSQPEDETVNITFPYQNTSAGKVEIVEFKSGCSSCLSAGPKKTLKPGQKGQVDAVFKIGSYTGSVKKTLNVISRDEQGIVHDDELILTVTVPELIHVEPKHLKWALGGKLESKEFDITIPWKNPIRLTGVTCTRPNFTTEIITVEEGRHYRLKVTPQSLDVSQMGLLKVSTDCKFKKFETHMLFISVVK